MTVNMSSELQSSGHSDSNGLVNTGYMNERLAQENANHFHPFQRGGLPVEAKDYPLNTSSGNGVNVYDYAGNNNNTNGIMTVSQYDDEDYHRNAETPGASGGTAGPGGVFFGGLAGHHPGEHGGMLPLSSVVPHPHEGIENIAPPASFHHPGMEHIPPEQRVHWLHPDHPEGSQQPFHFQQHFHEHFSFQGPYPGVFPHRQIIIGPNGKPKRRRVATVAQRRAANIRERRRMFNLNEAFDTLRKKVPTFAYEKRLSRIETLRLAITYISFMADLVEGKDPKEIKLASVIKCTPWGAGLKRTDSTEEKQENECTGNSRESDTESQPEESDDTEVVNKTSVRKNIEG